MNKINEYILGLDFVKKALTRKYIDGYEAGEGNAIMQAHKYVDITEAVNEYVSSLLGTVDERKVVKIDTKGIVWLDNQMLDTSQAHNYQQEGDIIKQTGLWSLIENTIRASAHKRIFVDGKDEKDLLAGKMALYNLDLINKILTVFNRR